MQSLIIAILCLAASSESRYENVNVLKDWWETALIYQIYPRSFVDSDGDGIGDLNGITSKLKYLKEIGADAAGLAPIFKSPMEDLGYDVSDYYSIAPEYGTMEDFEQLLRKANELNIKVILELVPNHTSNQSDWFVKSSHGDEYYSDWYIWASGHINENGRKVPPNNWVSVFGKSAWSYVQQRDQYYLHQFGVSQPDLNFRNPVVVDEMKNILKFWLEKGVAGFKMSSINYLFEADKDLYGGRYPDEPITGKPGVCSEEYGYLDHVLTKDLEETYDMVSQFRDVFDAIAVRDNMTRVVFTEALTGIKNAVRYYGEGAYNGAQVPLNFALLGLGKKSDARDVKFAVDRWLTYKPLEVPANWMSGTHDKSRVATRFGVELVDSFNMLVLLLPGVSITYMGEEIGMEDGFVPWVLTKDPLACRTDDPVKYVDVSRDPFRTPFQWHSGKNAGFSKADTTWLPVAEGHEHLNMDNQRAADRSYYQVFRTLAKLRSRPAFRLGRFNSKALNHDVFAFKRWYNDDTYVVVMNLGRSYHVVNLSTFDLVFGQLEVEVSSVLSHRTFGDVVQASSVDLAAYEALVLRMQV